MGNELPELDKIFLAMISETLMEFNQSLNNGVAEKILERAENLVMGLADRRAQLDAWALQIMLNRDCTAEEAFEAAENFMTARLERYATPG